MVKAATSNQAYTFIVGDIFRHGAGNGDCSLFLTENAQNLAIKPNLKKVIPVPDDQKRLSEYSLPNNMNDSSIQKNAGNPGLLELEVFLRVAYVLLFESELAEQKVGYMLRKDRAYLFHVMVEGQKVVFNVYWDDGEWWYFDAKEFDNSGEWFTSYVFLYFAIV